MASKLFKSAFHRMLTVLYTMQNLTHTQKRLLGMCDISISRAMQDKGYTFEVRDFPNYDEKGNFMRHYERTDYRKLHVIVTVKGDTIEVWPVADNKEHFRMTFEPCGVYMIKTDIEEPPVFLQLIAMDILKEYLVK